jgi:hypothetical protein
LEGVQIESRLGTAGITGMVGDKVYPDVLEKHFLDALKAWDTAPTNTPEARLRKLEARVGIQVLADQGAVAKPECEQTRALLEARLAERPQDRASLTALAGAYVCLGRNADAVRVRLNSIVGGAVSLIVMNYFPDLCLPFIKFDSYCLHSAVNGIAVEKAVKQYPSIAPTTANSASNKVKSFIVRATIS